jgi:hypothetical protein
MENVMKRSCAVAAILCAPALAWAQPTVVVGTGNPDIDVPAVQAAVDQGGDVVLKGHFSFNRPPTVPTATTWAGGSATVLVSRAVTISGERDEHGHMRDEGGELTSIEGGTTPFYVEAAGAGVTIQGLRFIRPKGDAILVYAVSGLMVASCRIDGIESLPNVSGSGSDGIDVITSNGIPNPATDPGKPEKVSGTLLIVNNDIDLAGTAEDLTVGVQILSVGIPGAEVEAHVSGNTIRNTTEPAIALRRIGGRAYITQNVITTGSVVGTVPRPQVIRVVNTGSYLVAHNVIDCGWPVSDAQGIGVFSQLADWPMERANVVDNLVTMSAPEGTVFGSESAGIMIEGFAQGNVVMNNRIRGRARGALAVKMYRGGTPGNNAFVLNRFDDFEAAVADVFVDAGVVNTLIVGKGTVDDHGTGTVILPVAALPPGRDVGTVVAPCTSEHHSVTFTNQADSPARARSCR